MATCMRISRISSLVTPLVSAPLIWVRSSWFRLSALSMAILSMLRILSGSPSRPQTAPQQYSVTNRCIGMLKSSAAAKDFSTKSLPRTLLRIARSEEHTSELQSLMRISYAVFCLKKKKTHKQKQSRHHKYQTTAKIETPKTKTNKKDNIQSQIQVEQQEVSKQTQTHTEKHTYEEHNKQTY